MRHRRFSYSSKDEFLTDASQLRSGIPYSEDISVLGKPVTIETKKVKNRLVAQPIEGFDSGVHGAPGDKAIERYKTLGRGGVGTIWMESISVSYEGKSSGRQMWLKDENCAAFARLVEEIRENGAPFLVAQLTHSGRNSNPDGKGLAVCAFENPKIPRHPYRIISDQELDALRDDFVSAAVLAQRAGFDAVDVRACHGYLLNELLAAYGRAGKYGGTYENRTRLLKDIVGGIKRKTDIIVAVRLNATDGLPYPFGWGNDVHEPVRLVKELEQLGVSIVNVSAGIGATTPYMIRPYDSGGPIPDEHPLEGVERLLRSAKALKEAAPKLCVVTSGFTWLRQFAPMVAAGGIIEGWFDLAGFGREWIASPNFANDILSTGTMHKTCITCGGCTALIKNGKEMRCVVGNRLEKGQPI